jgi:hypothetical protein
MKGRRQLPGAGVSIALMISGVTIAPIETPDCRIEFPSARASGGSSRCVVCSAQGQWPDSNSPSSVRQSNRLETVFSPPNSPAYAVSTPMADHSVSTIG